MSIALSIGQLEGWVAQGFFPFARIGACLMVAPVFGARFVPARTRIILAVAITALVAPMIPTPDIAPFSPMALVVVFQQVLIGVALGFALQIVFDALGLAGQLLANSMGLSFSMNVDPLRGSSTPALGQLYIILATLTFLALDGHAALLELLPQEALRLLGAGEDDHPRGVAVQPVDGQRIPACGLQAGDEAILPVFQLARHGQEARRLVDHEDRLVLIEDRERPVGRVVGEIRDERGLMQPCALRRQGEHGGPFSVCRDHPRVTGRAGAADQGR